MTSPETLRDTLLIAGDWVGSSDGSTFPVMNPATWSSVASVADATAADAHRAIEAAAAGLATWRTTTGRERWAILERAARLMEERHEQLSVILTSETGKPIVEARAEIASTVRFFQWYSHEALRISGEYWPAVARDRDAVVVKEPIGVVVAITPWNFPSFMVACKVAPALAAGCSVVLKPAEQTPLSALAIAEILTEAGLPAGVLNVITASDARRVSEALLTSRDVECISFTGSREVGTLILKAAADGIKRVLLELGGNAPAVVLDDADIDLAVRSLLRARFANTGQACVAVNRIYVTEGVADEFISKFSLAAAGLRIGAAMDEGTQLGPLIDAAAFERIGDQVQAAIADGGRVVAGGGPVPGGGATYFQPTVIDLGLDESAVTRQEIFGPVALIQRCENEQDAVRRANDTEYGLSAYVFTRDQRIGMSVARRLVAGSVAINGALSSETQLPFGGMRTSGLGRERGRAGIEEFLELKTIHVIDEEGVAQR